MSEEPGDPTAWTPAGGHVGNEPGDRSAWRRAGAVGKEPGDRSTWRRAGAVGKEPGDRSAWRRAGAVAGAGALVIAVVVLVTGGSGDPGPDVAPTSTSSSQPTVGGFVELTPAEFVALWFDIQPRPGTSYPAEPYPITGDEAADAHIRRLAEARGYRAQPVSDSGAWQIADQFDALVEGAQADGIAIRFRSGFRPPSQQRTFFEARLDLKCRELHGRSCTADQIADGTVDDAVHAALDQISIPGYSSHHTGWVVDIADGDGEFIVDGTPAYEWLQADNYRNAKRFGFAPRYPVGAERLGPEPEPWEFYFAGVDTFVP